MTISSAHRSMIDSGSLTLADALLITRKDGQTFGFTSADIDAEIGGINYDSAQGLDISSLSKSVGLSVDNLALRTLDDGSLFTRVDILNGIWLESRFLIFRYDWTNPAAGAVRYRAAGTIGSVRLMRNTIEFELRGLQQFLQQPVGQITQKLCRNRLGVNDGFHSFCTVDVDGSNFRFTGTVTASAGQQSFTDSNLNEVDDFFGNGPLQWLTGANTGREVVVREYTADGSFVLDAPMWAAIQVGDQFVAKAGCRHRRDEDCIGKFDNILEYNGEPDMPDINDLTRPVLPGEGGAAE